MEKDGIILDYIKEFEEYGFGMFVHFGLYSIYAKGEWAENLEPVKRDKYEKLAEKFNPSKTWAKNLVETAKKTGCKYITLTTRHHDGFSLYDTKGITTFDAMHAKCNRDLIKEFVDACNEGGIVPFFYHTLVDWHNDDYNNAFSRYLDYLYKSVEVLCTNYGKIGGLWFDGSWDKKDVDWKFDRLYSMIRRNQPKAMIINNTGLSQCGKISHKEIDSVTFERAKPCFVDSGDKHVAGEMCQVLNDHWGYAKEDCNYKSVAELIENLIDCRKYNCNFLLNTGLKGDGSVNAMDKAILGEIGKWVDVNKGFIYKVKASDIKAEGAEILFDGEYYYAVIKNVPMIANPNVQYLGSDVKVFKIYANVDTVQWLDNGKQTKIRGGIFEVLPYKYGRSYSVRIARFKIK